MDVGICWPTPGAEPQSLPDGKVLETLRQSTGATHLRVDLDHRRNLDELMNQVRHIRSFGFEVLPIIDCDRVKPRIEDYAVVCGELAREFPVVELGNEPNTRSPRIPAERYAETFTAGAEAIRERSPSTRIYIACEPTKPIGRKVDFWAKVRRRVDPRLYDVAAIHPYRNPLSPGYSPMGNRAAEFAYYQSQVGGLKRIAVSEVGWPLSEGIVESGQADYTYQELKIWQGFEVEAVYIYAFMDDGPAYRFGILDENRQPRPVAAAIRRFQEERGAA